MKKKSIMGFALLVLLLVTGCSNGEKTEPSPLTTMPTKTELSESDGVEMERVDPKNLSAQAQKDLEDRKGSEGAYVFTDNGKNYLVAFAGERNTGGYGIEIIEILQSESELVVSAETSEPGPDMMTIQALTYPMDLVELINVENLENLFVSLEIENGTVSHENDGRTDEGYYISPTLDYETGDVITIGDIVAFEGSYIHIIAGDLIEVFSYDINQEGEFYLGQKVQLIKGDHENYLEPFLVEDFSVRHTNMGQLINVQEGQVVEVGNESMTLLTEGLEKTFVTYQTPLVSIGEFVEVHYMNFGEGSEDSIIAIYGEASKMEMIVREVHRTNNGELILYTSDRESEKIDYHVSIGGGTVTELNYSEVQPGDFIIVYADEIMESYPAQVQARRVIK
ncbi:hypothetical protein SANA_14720 [Gottschalkiaceae bacterium SANA]|nr:hypothetical protein SANA_14720 [Gottschalkiaceae bacterium SANA]